jgi:hypothetical protein
MAYRYEGGIDLSGALGTIAAGMERAALMKKQQDQLAESKVDDFLKMYQPGKLRTNDLPDFINAYNQYKQSALNYSRLNRAGKDANLISAADVQMQKALGNLNQVYSKSSTLADRQAEYADYLKAARAKGYEVPTEVSGIINTLTSSKLSDLDLNNIPSAYSFDLMPKEIDLAKIAEGLDRTQAKIKEVTSTDEQFVWGQDINGKPIMATKTTKYLGRDPKSTVDFLSIMSRTNPKINNQAKEDYSLFRTSFEQNSPAAQERLNEIKEYFPTVKTIDDVTPEMNYGLMFYRKQPQAPIINERAAKQAYDLAVDRARIAQGQQRINIQMGDKKDTSDYHPSVIIKSIVEGAKPILLGGQKGGMQQLGNYDVTNEFKGFTIKNDLGENVPVDEVKYVAGYGNVEPYFSVRAGNQTQQLQPMAFNRAIVSSMPDINFKIGSVSLDNLSSPKATATTKKTSGTYVTPNGKSYSKSDLLKAGYTEQQIQEAIKLGNIKPK